MGSILLNISENEFIVLLVLAFVGANAIARGVMLLIKTAISKACTWKIRQGGSAEEA